MLCPVIGVQWLSGFERWTGDTLVLGLNPAAATLLRNFGNSVYRTLTVPSGGGETIKAVGPLYLVSMPGEV